MTNVAAVRLTAGLSCVRRPRPPAAVLAADRPKVFRERFSTLSHLRQGWCAPCDMTGIRSQRKCVPREAIRLSRRQVCARAPARYLFNGQVGGAAAPEQEALAKMMTLSSVPP